MAYPKRKHLPNQPKKLPQASDAILQGLAARRNELGGQWKELDARKRQAEQIVAECDTRLKATAGAAGEVDRMLAMLNPEKKKIEPTVPEAAPEAEPERGTQKEDVAPEADAA